MAREKSYEAIAPVAFTADGQNNGIVTITSTFRFKVKMAVVLSASGIEPKRYQVKRVLSDTQMVLGEEKKSLHNRSDLTAYSLSLSPTVKATEQDRPNIPPADYERAVYEEEPIVAKRVVSVDRFGNTYGKSHEGQQQTVEGSVTGSVFNNMKLAYNPTLQVEYIGESPFATLDSENGHFIQKIVYDSVLNATRVLLATGENENSDIQNITIFVDIVGPDTFVDLTANVGEFKELEPTDKLGTLTDGSKTQDKLMDISINTTLGTNQSFSGKIVEITDSQNIRILVLSGSPANETTTVKKGDITTKANGEISSLLQRSWTLREDYVYRVREDE